VRNCIALTESRCLNKTTGCHAHTYCIGGCSHTPLLAITGSLSLSLSHTHTHTHAHMHTHAQTYDPLLGSYYICMNICKSTQTYSCSDTRLTPQLGEDLVCAFSTHTHISTKIQTHISAYSSYTHTHTHIRTHVRAHTGIYVHMHATQMHTHAHIRQVHTYTHAHTLLLRWVST
jgi:hypothetical protein